MFMIRKEDNMKMGIGFLLLVAIRIQIWELKPKRVINRQRIEGKRGVNCGWGKSFILEMGLAPSPRLATPLIGWCVKYMQ